MIYGGVRVDVERLQIAKQPALGHRVGADGGVKLTRHVREYLRHVHVLPPRNVPVLRKVGAELSAVGQGAKLPVHGGDEGRQLLALFPKMLRQILDGKPPVFDEGVGRVVHRAERVHILRVPAAVLIPAFYADLVRRAVVDFGDVLVVALGVYAGFHYLEQLCVCVAEILHPVGDKAPQSGLAAAPLHALKNQRYLR